MAIDIPTPLVEFILLGPADDRRQLQDSPILGDVWVAFAKKPDDRLELLITPFMLQAAGTVASALNFRYHALFPRTGKRHPGPDLAYLQGIIAAKLSFQELLRVVVPMTSWWDEKYRDPESLAGEKPTEGDKPATIDQRTPEDGKDTRAEPSAGAPPQTPAHELQVYGDPGKMEPIVDCFIRSANTWRAKTRQQEPKPKDKTRIKRNDDGSDPDAKKVKELTSLDRYVLLAGLILWAAEAGKGKGNGTIDEKIDGILERDDLTQGIVNAVEYVITQVTNDFMTIHQALEQARVKRLKAPQEAEDRSLVWQVSLNRTANPALAKSVPAVKADAAKFLFKVDTSNIAWAVLDSGIDGRHPVFRKKAVLDRQPQGEEPKIRIKKSFDFRNFRKIISLSNDKPGVRAGNLDAILKHEGLKILGTGDAAASEQARARIDKLLVDLAKDAGRGAASVHWNLVEQLVEIDPTTEPDTDHGTHVAGIIGASRDRALEARPDQGKNLTGTNARKVADIQDGMCPEINLFDFRVIGPTMEDTEFAIIGALQYIRYLNDRDNFFTIHGANLSLSIPHDVRNFACGSTPICKECERLVDSGVVVVAAAGNHGYKSFETKEGYYESYAAFSITDPGNADGVITVGATHRNWPHTYGVSFFSSRGPTGDGRLKPDLVAPGERIRAPIRSKIAEDGGLWGDLDGTSMAAPHVSGAAAMLMARYSELIGQPRRIKQILCATATDLGRERSFQGHGMLDVLRAFQSI